MEELQNPTNGVALSHYPTGPFKIPFWQMTVPAWGTRVAKLGTLGDNRRPAKTLREVSRRHKGSERARVRDTLQEAAKYGSTDPVDVEHPSQRNFLCEFARFHSL